MFLRALRKILGRARGRAELEEVYEGKGEEISELVKDKKLGRTKKAEYAARYREKIKLDPEKYAIYLENKRKRDRNRAMVKRMKNDMEGVVEELRAEYEPEGVRGGMPHAYHKRKYRLKIRSNPERHEEVKKRNRERKREEVKAKLREEILREIREEVEVIRRDVL